MLARGATGWRFSHGDRSIGRMLAVVATGWPCPGVGLRPCCQLSPGRERVPWTCSACSASEHVDRDSTDQRPNRGESAQMAEHSARIRGHRGPYAHQLSTRSDRSRGHPEVLAGDIGKAAEEMSKELQQRLGPSRGRRRTTSSAIYQAAGSARRQSR